MKNTLFIVFSIFYLSTTAQVPKNGLVAYYKFDKESDTTKVFDSSGNANHGTMVNDVSYAPDRFRVGCSAMWFGGSGFVHVPSSPSLKQPEDELTIAVWLNIADGADFFKEWITICCKSDQSEESDDSPQYRMQATAQTFSINTEFTENYIPQLAYDKWYFYAYTYDGSNVMMYLNGAKVFEFPYSGRLVPNDMPLEIGRDLPGALEYFNGTMDDLRIYNRGLSASEIEKLYNDQTGRNKPNRCIIATPITPPPPQPTVNLQPPTPTPPPPPVPIPLPPLDTVVAPTTPAAIDTFKNLPPTLENVPIHYQKVVKVKSKEIKIYPYDNDKEDGDIVSININGVWVRDNYELKNKKSNPAPRTLIRCSLQDNDSNYFVSKACNLGDIPPNTLTIEIDDGFTIQKVHLNSKIGLNGGIKIICEK